MAGKRAGRRAGRLSICTDSTDYSKSFLVCFSFQVNCKHSKVNVPNSMNHSIRQQARSKILPLLRKFHQNHEKSITRQFQACIDIIVLLTKSSREMQIYFHSIVTQDEYFITRLMKFFDLTPNLFLQWKEAQFSACLLLNLIVKQNEQILEKAVGKFVENDDLIKQLIQFINCLFVRDDVDSCKTVRTTLQGCIRVLCILCIESTMCCCYTLVNDGLQIFEKFVNHDTCMVEHSLELKRLSEGKCSDKHSNGKSWGRLIQNELENNGDAFIGDSIIDSANALMSDKNVLFDTIIVELAITTEYLCRAVDLCSQDDVVSSIKKFGE